MKDDTKFYLKYQDKRKWAKYRWEFMRRSPEYRKDYREIEELRKKVQLPADLEQIRKEKGVMIYPNGQYQQEAQTERDVCRKYELGVEFMLDPKKSFDELELMDVNYEAEGEAISIKGRQVFELFCASVLKQLSVIFSVSDEDVEKVTLEIDFSKVNSISALAEYTREMLEDHCKKISKGKKHIFFSKPYGDYKSRAV
jgi:hypothetical protein